MKYMAVKNWCDYAEHKMFKEPAKEKVNIFLKVCINVKNIYCVIFVVMFWMIKYFWPIGMVSQSRFYFSLILDD